MLFYYDLVTVETMIIMITFCKKSLNIYVLKTSVYCTHRLKHWPDYSKYTSKTNQTPIITLLALSIINKAPHLYV